MQILSCSEGYLPGFDFNSFEATPVEELADAVEADDPDAIAEFLLQNKKLIDYQEQEFGHSVLFLAVVNHKYNAVKSLLGHGASISLKDYSDSSDVLMTLCKGYGDNECDTTMLGILLQDNPDLRTFCYDSQGNRITLLCKASDSMFGCMSFIQMLVSAGADVNYNPENKPDCSPVCAALLVDRLDLARYYLIDCKAEVAEYLFLRPQGDARVPVTITQFLNEQSYASDPKQQQLKEEILAYLKSIGKE